jgi:hypothetical protein
MTLPQATKIRQLVQAAIFKIAILEISEDLYNFI